MFKMEIGADVKRDNWAGAADNNNVTAQREKQTPASVLTPEARQQTDREPRRKDKASFQRQRIS